MSDAPPLVITSCTLGQYNLCSTERQWCVRLYVDGIGGVSATWPEDEEQDIRDEPPSAVLDLIEAREARLWLNTARERDRALYAKMRERMEEIDAAWATKQAAYHERLASDHTRTATRLRNAYLPQEAP